MDRWKIVAAATGLMLAGPAFAADLDVALPQPVVVAPVVVPEPTIVDEEEPIPVTGIPFGLLAPIFPSLAPPPHPPPMSPTLFSSSVAYPVPHPPRGHAQSDDEAEAMHYGYHRGAPVRQLPLGGYGFGSLD